MNAPDEELPEEPNETALLSEAALAVDWNRPEEDAAWSHLSGYRANLEEYEERLARGEIKW